MAGEVTVSKGDAVRFYPGGKAALRFEETEVTSDPYLTASGVWQVFIRGRGLGVNVELLEKISLPGIMGPSM